MKWRSGITMLATVLLFAATVPGLATSDDQSSATKAVWDRHVQAAVSGDIDAVMEDFTDDSVIITTDGVIAGKAAIREFFEAFLGGATEAPVVNHEIVHDNIVVFNFSEGGQTFHDTAIIADDRIMAISTVAYASD